jgi:hypothetical protein
LRPVGGLSSTEHCERHTSGAKALVILLLYTEDKSPAYRPIVFVRRL